MEQRTNGLEGVRRYFSKRESRWGYRYLLGGSRHFGIYPYGRRGVSMRAAQTFMTDRLAKSLDLPIGSRVLDAGCGEGGVATHLVQRYRLRVEGIDIIPESVQRARTHAVFLGLGESLHFTESDYSHLPFPDNSFDGVYTMETLVHSSHYPTTLEEFSRVLKPGGRLVLCEYSVGNPDRIETAALVELSEIFYLTAMYSLPEFTHDALPVIVRSAGFVDVTVENITDEVEPMLKRLYQLAIIPFQLVRIFGLQRRFVNVWSAVAGYRHRRYFQYNIVRAIRSIE